MILVDTSIWIDHFHGPESGLVALLHDDLVASHPLVLEELALGSLKNRETVLGLIAELPATSVVTHSELLALVARHRLWGRGLSPADAHLLGSVIVTPATQLWTRDKRLQAAAIELGAPLWARGKSG